MVGVSMFIERSNRLAVRLMRFLSSWTRKVKVDMEPDSQPSASTINFVAGISLSGALDDEPLIDLTILSCEDSEYHKFRRIKQITNLQDSLKNTFDSLPEGIRTITITTPSYYTEDDKKKVKRAAKLAGLKNCHWSDSIMIIQRERVEIEHPPRAELLIEIGSNIVYSRLVSTDVESGIRCSDVLYEESVDKTSPLESLLATLIDQTLQWLHDDQPVCGSTLHKVLVTSCLDSISQCDLKIKFPSPDIIIETNISGSAAKHSLSCYHSMLEAVCIFNVTPLNLGIAKADGFVHTLIPRNFTLPNRQIAIFTTERQGQRQATVNVVVGLSPCPHENRSIAKVTITELECRDGRAPQIKVTLDVEQDRRTHITVDELATDGTVRQRATQDLSDVIGDDMDWDDVGDIIAGDNGQGLDNLAEEAAMRWMGARVSAGALPE